MPITNYTELVAAIDGASGYLHRTDLTAKIPDFIRLAESELNSDLSLLLQETEATLTATVGSRLIAQPTRFGTPIALWCTTYSPRIEIRYQTPELLPVTENNGAARFYTVDGTNIATDNPADVAYTYTLRYIPTWDIATTSTNVVLTNWPKAYIFGTLLQSVATTRDMSQVAYWQSEYDKAIAKAQRDSTATKGKQTLRCDGFFTQRRPNIYAGF